MKTNGRLSNDWCERYPHHSAFHRLVAGRDACGAGRRTAVATFSRRILESIACSLPPGYAVNDTR